MSWYLWCSFNELQLIPVTSKNLSGTRDRGSWFTPTTVRRSSRHKVSLSNIHIPSLRDWQERCFLKSIFATGSQVRRQSRDFHCMHGVQRERPPPLIRALYRTLNYLKIYWKTSSSGLLDYVDLYGHASRHAWGHWGFTFPLVQSYRNQRGYKMGPLLATRTTTWRLYNCCLGQRLPLLQCSTLVNSHES